MVKCNECRFCHGIDQAFEVLECRRHAPTVQVTTNDDLITYVAVWPVVDQDDCCGEGSRRA